MKCAVCGRANEHCKRCHFVHDNMELLDATTIGPGQRIRSVPPPWRIGLKTEQRVRDAWAKYEVSA